MKYKTLGRTDIEVSEICLGSMTWGSQNTEDEGHAQIDMALDHDVNFIDAAEMYPVNPVRAETIGRTEEIIGSWFAKSGRRSDVVMATKCTGEGMRYVRGGAPVTGETIAEAVEGSLKRMQTDYIDLYQLHWPNRGSFHFRKIWAFDATGQEKGALPGEIEDILGALQREVDKGRIRAFGLSNESAWGTAQWLRIAEDKGLPRVATMQNEYSLLCRHFDSDLAEMCHHEDVGLLAYSPLATGLLTGKYQNGKVPEGSRMSVNKDLSGRATPRAFAAVDAYLAVAQKHGLDPVQMSVAWTLSRPFMTAPIIGAVNLEQLALEISAADVVLSDEVLADIDAAHRDHPMPN